MKNFVPQLFVQTLQRQSFKWHIAGKNRQSRWNGASSQVYSRGMIVAFLCDVALLRESRGKRSISDVFRRILNKYRLPNKPQEGNIAILNVVESYAELQPIVDKFIKGTEKINWQADLESVGIEAAETDFNTKLNVKAKLNKQQKNLLDDLGVSLTFKQIRN